MVYGVVKTFQAALKYPRWRGLLEHMYTVSVFFVSIFIFLPLLSKNGDYPFKFGTYMGSDAAGNRYYENRVDYPFGQHRWVEPGDIHNFDSTSIAPEWQGWMNSQSDEPPCAEGTYVEEKSKHIIPLCQSYAPDKTNIGYQVPMFHFHHLHNQTQVHSRGYVIML